MTQYIWNIHKYALAVKYALNHLPSGMPKIRQSLHHWMVAQIWPSSLYCGTFSSRSMGHLNVMWCGIHMPLVPPVGRMRFWSSIYFMVIWVILGDGFSQCLTRILAFIYCILPHDHHGCDILHRFEKWFIPVFLGFQMQLSSNRFPNHAFPSGFLF